MSKEEAEINPKKLHLEKEGEAKGKGIQEGPSQEADDVVSPLVHELELEIFARVPCFEYWKLLFLNKRYLELVKSSKIFKIRRELGLVKPYVFMRSGSDTNWKMFDKDFKNFLDLPKLPSDRCFFYGSTEVVCVGTHLLVIGRDIKGMVVWRYELEMYKWFKCPPMITPRVKYGFASHGTNAIFAGGIMPNEKGIIEVVNTAEKYDGITKTWSVINKMHKKRKFSSACFLHGKFYVLGGRDENNEYLICGESYDEETDSWNLIPDMLKEVMSMSSQWPPPIAVIQDHLYLLESSSNELCLYDISENSWKKLGVLPVIANSSIGWRVTFTSIGERLLLVGASPAPSQNTPIKVYTCCPSPNMKEVIWEEPDPCCNGYQLSYVIQDFCVMFA